jgi:hypothetical protein
MNDVNRRRATVRLQLPIRPLFTLRSGSHEAACEARLRHLARTILHGLTTQHLASSCR